MVQSVLDRKQGHVLHVRTYNLVLQDCSMAFTSKDITHYITHSGEKNEVTARAVLNKVIATTYVTSWSTNGQKKDVPTPLLRKMHLQPQTTIVLAVEHAKQKP